MDSYGSTTNPFQGATNPFVAGAQASPLASDWSGYFANQLSSKKWWKDEQAPFSYGSDFGTGYDFDYDPGSSGSPYGPISSMTNRIIDSQIENWLQREHPELFDFTSGLQYGGVAGAGTVSSNPTYNGNRLGYFHQTPEVFPAIQAAANKYGVPANFLLAIIHRESSGDWNSNNTWVNSVRGGARIYGFVGVFENAATAWGFNFDSLNNNMAGQIEMLASGLRRFYDKLHAQNPQYGWLNVAAYHFSGKPDITGYVDELGNRTGEYVATVEGIWKENDALVGNTWSNYTDPGQNKGIGSPQNQAWGQYAQWDQALVGMSTNLGVPANLMKAVLRYGDEAGMGFSNNFDNGFSPVAQRIQQSYTQTGSWDTAVATAMGLDVQSSAYLHIKTYWDELNADMSGVFGGPSGGSNGVVGNQYEAAWGGGARPINQEHGRTAFSSTNPDGMYNYSIGVLGYLGHPGLDVDMDVGTPLYAPVAGLVIRAGGSGSYFNTPEQRYTPGSGELRILLDNGDHLIMGHMSNITVHEGDRVTPGMSVGASGYPSGPHLHYEYRTPNPAMSSGWEAIDPRIALGGAFTGYTQGARTGLGYTQALTFQNLMRAGASGQPIPSGATFVQGGGRSAWTNWLRNAMMGNDVSRGRSGSIDYSKLYNIGGTPAGNAT